MNKSMVWGLVAILTAGILGYLVCGSPSPGGRTVRDGGIEGIATSSGTGPAGIEARAKNGRFVGLFSRVFESSDPDDPTRSDHELQNLVDDMKKLDDSPEELWYPNGQARIEVERQTKYLRRLVELGAKMQQGTATKDEQKKYHEIKIVMMQAKIDFIQGAVETLSDSIERGGGDQARDIESANKMIQELVKRLEKSKKEIESL